VSFLFDLGGIQKYPTEIKKFALPLGISSLILAKDAFVDAADIFKSSTRPNETNE